jgi:uncharacterized membrane protein
MKIQTKRAVFIITLCVGVLWNILCLVGILPVDKCMVTLPIIFMGTFLILLPYIYPSMSNSLEKSKYIKELNKKEKTLAVITLALIFCWAVTLIMCLLIQN